MTDHRPPRDVIPPPPPSREDILRWNAAMAAGTTMNISEPGEILTDPDGVPIGVGPSSTTRETIGCMPVYRDQLAAAGLTEDDVPNLTIIDRKGT